LKDYAIYFIDNLDFLIEIKKIINKYFNIFTNSW
jgi:hypothetical protein